MKDLLLFTSCLAITIFIGWNIFCAIRGRKDDFSFLETVGLSCLFGFGAVSFEMFIIGLFGLKFTIFNILIVWLPLVVFNIVSKKSTIEIGKIKRPITRFEAVLMGLISLQVLYNLFRALIKPIASYDAVAIYAIKAKVLFLAHGIGGDFFQGLGTFFRDSHPDYPLFVPLSETWIYTFLGKFNDIIVKAIFPIFYLSFIFIFYTVIKRLTNKRSVAILFTFLVATVKQFADYSTISVADMLLGIFFAISIVYLYLWIVERKKGFLNISLLGTLCLIWTKNEGLLLSLITVAVGLNYLATRIKTFDKKSIKDLTVYIACIIVAFIGWSLFKQQNALVNENFNLSMISIKGFFQNINRLPAIMYEYQKHIFGFKKWNIIWIVAGFLFIKYVKDSLSGNIKYITFALLIFLTGYTLVYVFSAVEIGFLLSTTWSRFLLHILPVAVFWMAILGFKEEFYEEL